MFLKNWVTWPSLLIDCAAKVLAIIDPEELLRLFENDLNRFKQGGVDPLRFVSIDQLRTYSNDVPCTVFLKQVSQGVIDKQPNDFGKTMLVYSLLKVSQHLDWDTLESSINSVLQIENNQSHPRRLFESLFTGVFGGDFLKGAASDSLTEIGSSAQAALIKQWDGLDDSQKIYGLSVINNIHGKAAADFAVTRFSELLAEDIESACELILASPDSRLLELLKFELRRKQPLIDRTFYICARLLNYDGPETQGAKERALVEFERDERTFESMETGDIPNQDQLFLDLACPLCKDVNRYQVKGVIMSSDPEAGFLLNDEFPCVSCGQDVEFELTPMATMMLGVKLLGHQLSAKAGSEENDQFKIINYTSDGYDMPLAKGLALKRNYLAKHPNDVQQWLSLGNLLSHLNRPKETLAAFRKAHQIEPNAVDVSLALAITLNNNQQETEAWEVMQKALIRMPSRKLLMSFPDFNEEFVGLYNYLRKTLGKYDLPPLLPSALNSSKKTGRNESCPCGSGKKFKRCCGQ